MSTSATRRILHISTENISDLRETQIGNALSAFSYYKSSESTTHWGGKDTYGQIQHFASWDKSVVFEKLYLGGDGNSYSPITIARGAFDDEPFESTTRAFNSINIGRGSGINMVDESGHINIGDFAGAYSKGGSPIYGQNVNIGYYGFVNSNGFGNVNIGSTTTYRMDGNYNCFIGINAGIYTSGNSNAIVGNAGANYLNGNKNVGIGKDTLNNAFGDLNVALGEGAFSYCNNNYSIGIGHSAGLRSKSTSGSVSIGRGSGYYTSGNYNVSLGSDSGWQVSGDNNVNIGRGIGINTVGQDNIYIGRDGISFTSGSLNIVMGTGVAYPYNTSPKNKREKCILFGQFTAEVVDEDIENVIAIGDHVCASATTINRVVGIGMDTLRNASNANDVVALGTSAGYYSQHPNSEMIGYKAGSEGENINGEIVAIGYQAGYKSNSYRTIMIGSNAGANTPSGLALGTFVGDEAGRYGQMNDCIAIGEQAGYGASAMDSLFIGELAGKNSTGSNCVFIGENAGENNTENNKFAVTNGSNILLSGDFTTKEVIIDHVKFPQTTEPTVVSGHAYIFASAAGAFGTLTELFVEDSDSNITKISPHNDDGEWEYYSVNRKTGKTIKINMEKFIRRMEQFTGEKFIEEL